MKEQIGSVMACKILKVVSFFVCVGHISGQEGEQNINYCYFIQCDVYAVELAILLLTLT